MKKLNPAAPDGEDDTQLLRESRRPSACAVDHDIGLDAAARRTNGVDPVGSDFESKHFDPALDRGPCGFRCRQEASERAMLVQIAVAGTEPGA